MELKEYQNILINFKNYPTELGAYYDILSLTRELGILSDKVLSTLQDPNYELTEKDKQKIGISIGDMMYWLVNMATDLGLHIEDDIVSLNLRKLNLLKEKEIHNNLLKNSQ